MSSPENPGRFTTRNRASWNKESDAYQDLHGPLLAEKSLAWGVWRIPEAELNVLGNVAGRDVLELGCGAAQWTMALNATGARTVGIDLSERQLDHARRASVNAGVTVPLVHGTAERLPFLQSSFDVVFCDHGATVFSPPALTIPEASRVLRSGGLFAFCMSSPIRDLCQATGTDTPSERLQTDYFDLHEITDEDMTYYQLAYGEWIRLFRRSAFEVEDLIEIRAPRHGKTSYDGFVQHDWARRWPAENIWKLRKRAV